MKKCFGIISWFPDESPARGQRQDRINRLFKQLNDLWPTVDILVIAQNWKDFKPTKISNKVIIKNYSPLGILWARKMLRREFLKLDYDYIIMFDDDAIIETKNEAHLKYMEEVDKHPNGFCFIHGAKNNFDDYKAAQLNLCAISRYIYEKEDIPNVNPQKNQGFEDHVYSLLLHVKYKNLEFMPPKDITHIQFQNKEEEAPSTWARQDGVRCSQNIRHTDYICACIVAEGDIPNLDAYYAHEKLLEEQSKKLNSDGSRRNAYLYF